MTTTTTQNRKRTGQIAVENMRTACEQRDTTLDQVLDALDADWSTRRRLDLNGYPNPYINDIEVVGRALGIETLHGLCDFLIEVCAEAQS